MADVQGKVAHFERLGARALFTPCFAKIRQAGKRTVVLTRPYAAVNAEGCLCLNTSMAFEVGECEAWAGDDVVHVPSGKRFECVRVRELGSGARTLIMMFDSRHARGDTIEYLRLKGALYT